MSEARSWIIVNEVPINTTPDQMARLIQRALGVTVDGKIGAMTLTAFANRKQALATANPTSSAEVEAQRLANMARSDIASRSISGDVFKDMIRYGLSAPDAQIRLSLSSPYPWGLIPPFGQALPGAPTSAPSTARPATPGTPAPVAPPASSLTAGARLSAFYTAYKTPINVLAVVAGVAAVGGLAYMLTRPSEDGGGDLEGGLPEPRELPMGEMSAEDAARLLGIRRDSDASSIRAAYARQVRGYPAGDPDSEQGRAEMRAARDALLAYVGA